MKIKYIVDALNHYYLDKFPNARGWFISKESFEPTKVNLYKKYKVELYYHIPGKNYLAYSQQMIDRCPEGAEEDLKERFLTVFIKDMFANLENFDKYETTEI